MRILVTLMMLLASLFATTWEDRYAFEKVLFEHELSVLAHNEFSIKKYEKFQPLIKEFNLEDDFTKLQSSKSVNDFFKYKNRFLLDFDKEAFLLEKKDFIDFGMLDEDVSFEQLLTYRAKKAYVTLSRIDLKSKRTAYDKLYNIFYLLERLKKPLNKQIKMQLLNALEKQDIKAFKQGIYGLESIIQSLQTQKLSQNDFEKKIKSFLRYNKLVAFDYKNGIDDGNIKVPLEYTEAVMFSARAKSILYDIKANIADDDFKQLLKLYNQIVLLIEKKDEPAKVRDLTLQTKEIILASTGLAEIQATSSELVSTISKSLDQVVQMAEAKDFKQAEFFRMEAYSFFDPDIEAKLNPRDPQLTKELEGLFWNGSHNITGLSVAIKNQDIHEIQKSVNYLKEKLKTTIPILDAKLTFANALTQSSMIVIREGLEIVLVLALLLSLLKRKREKQVLYFGVFLGFLASIATYYLAKYLIDISTANRELIEGASALLAAIMLIFITAWIFHNTYVKGWVQYSKELAQKSLSTKNKFALLIVGFLVFYREGFESVLFFESLGNEAGAKPVWIGFLLGSFIIIILGIAIIKYVKKIPLQYFFSITGFFLSMLAVIFTGTGIRGLQTANLVSVTPSDYLPNSEFLSQYFGYYPTVETSFAQLFVILLLSGFYLFSKFNSLKGGVKI